MFGHGCVPLTLSDALHLGQHPGGDEGLRQLSEVELEQTGHSIVVIVR